MLAKFFLCPPTRPLKFHFKWSFCTHITHREACIFIKGDLEGKQKRLKGFGLECGSMKEQRDKNSCAIISCQVFVAILKRLIQMRIRENVFRGHVGDVCLVVVPLASSSCQEFNSFPSQLPLTNLFQTQIRNQKRTETRCRLYYRLY